MVVFGAPAQRLVDGPYSWLRIKNTGNASAWIGDPSVARGAGMQVRPNDTVALPSLNDETQWVLCDPGGARLELVGLSA